MHYTLLLHRTHEQAVHIRHLPSTTPPRVIAGPRAAAASASASSSTAGHRIARERDRSDTARAASAPRRPARAARAAGARRRASHTNCDLRAEKRSRRMTRRAISRADVGVAEEAHAAIGIDRARLRLRDVVQQRRQLQQRGAAAALAQLLGQVRAQIAPRTSRTRATARPTATRRAPSRPPLAPACRSIASTRVHVVLEDVVGVELAPAASRRGRRRAPAAARRAARARRAAAAPRYASSSARMRASSSRLALGRRLERRRGARVADRAPRSPARSSNPSSAAMRAPRSSRSGSSSNTDGAVHAHDAARRRSRKPAARRR